MKQSLDLRLGQHLTITPQLQQAIRLLQLSSIELQQEIQEALETNPLLEEQEEGADSAREEGEAADDAGADTPSETVAETTADATAEASADTATETTAADSEAEPLTATDMGMDERAADDTASDDGDWGDNFELAVAPSSRPDDDNLPDLEARTSLPQTLRDQLAWQMRLTLLSETDRRIAEAIIDAINDDGYLSVTLEDIQQALSREGLAVELDEIEAVLHQVQSFEPLGVGARDVAECLRLQLRACGESSATCDLALRLTTPEHLELLAARDYNQLKRLLKVNAEELQAAIELIQRMNPRPGASLPSAHAAYVVPDIIVKKVKGVWRAELNGDVAPRLRINRQYERLIHRGDSSAQNKYLQDQLQQARWLIKSLNSRNDTLLKVARTIVDRQRAFFDHGPEAMKPLVLHDVAETVNMHESTISRVTTNKYMLTPRGIFELKYFFSSHVATADGGTCSATAIRSIIKKLVEAEAPDKPISDSKIAEILENQGINVARRTVAKYREFMNIPPSNQRRSLNVKK
jgi:RNA polymerase sigma-54 factor